MPYIREGKCVYKKNADGSKGESMGCSESEAKAEAHMRALYANTKDSVFAEFSLAIVKASYNTNDPDPNKRMTFRMSSSDTGKDLADEAMSLELFNNFTRRIRDKDIPEAFKSAICEDAWCGGMPYLSIAHYRAGADAKNVPGEIEEVFVDGDILKSKGHCFDNPMGHAVFNSLLEDSYKHKSGEADHDPVRVSIGFLDLKHKHVPGGNAAWSQEVIFERKSLADLCPLCEQGIGGKIYLDGVLVHEAMTRVPMNPRTLMVADLEEKSMADEIKSKSDDARSIVGDLADTLEEKSRVDDVLVVKSDGTTTGSDTNVPDPSNYADCYDSNTGGYDQKCIDSKVANEMVSAREGMPAVKSLLDGVYTSLVNQYKSNGFDLPIVEEAKRKDVSESDKKRAEKEYGDVKYADETNKKYPIDTEEHIRAAWNYIHQARNAAKYPDHGAAIKHKIVAAWKRVIGGAPPSAEKDKSNLEVNMEQKATLAGTSVPEVPFKFDGVESPPHELNKAPVKARPADEAEADDNPKEEKEEMKSALDTSFEGLKSLLASGKATAEEVNQAFAALGGEVEKSYTPPAPDMSNLAEIVKSAVESAVAPLRVEIATLKATQKVDTVSRNQAPASRTLRLQPQDLIQRTQPAAPTKKLTQIEKLARKSVYAGIGVDIPVE